MPVPAVEQDRCGRCAKRNKEVILAGLCCQRIQYVNTRVEILPFLLATEKTLVNSRRLKVGVYTIRFTTSGVD